MRKPSPQLYLGIACLLCLLLYEVQHIGRHVQDQVASGNLNGTDFHIYRLFAKRFLRDPSTLYDMEYSRPLEGYTYPPLSILVFLPLTACRETTAYLLFQAASVVAAVLSCLLVLDARRRLWPRESPAQGACFTLLVAISGPAFSNLVMGQVNAIVVFLCLSAVWLSQRRWHALAGLALAFACWIKIYPTLLLVAMVASRTHRRSGVMTLTFGVLVPACFLWAVPFHLYTRYFLEVLPGVSALVMTSVYNQSIAALLARLGLPYDQWQYRAATKAALWLRIVNALALLGAMALFVARRVRQSRDFVLLSLLALSLVPLIGPLSWGHSFVFSIYLVAYCIVFPVSQATRVLALVAWAFLLVPAYSNPHFLGSLPVAVRMAVHFRYPVAVVLVFGIALRQLLASRGKASTDAENAPRPAPA